MAEACPWLVVTTCSARKRERPIISAAEIDKGTQSEVVERWLSLLRRSHEDVAAEHIYAGRAFSLAKNAAATFGHELAVVSAGLGFLPAGTPIPSYDLTLAPGAVTSIQNKVRGRFDYSGWWKSVSGSVFSSSLGNAILAHDRSLICLSAPYAKLVASELSAAVARGAAVRLFGLALEKHLPPALRLFVLPYDERLNQIGLKGTRVDFAQRAMRHYLENIAPKIRGIEEERARVSASLAQVSKRRTIVRRQVSDAEVGKIIRDNIHLVRGGCSGLLRFVRHECNVACEQGRFRNIYQGIVRTP